MKIKDKIIITLIIITLIAAIYTIGYRTAQMEYENVSVTTYAPDSINI